MRHGPAPPRRAVSRVISPHAGARDGGNRGCRGARRGRWGGSSTPGGFADCLVVPGGQVFDASGIDAQLAVFAEPAACIAHLMDRLGLLQNQTAIVLGAGPTGVLLSQFLMHSGEADVSIADPNIAKLERAGALADVTTFLVDRGDVDGSMQAIIRQRGRAFDVVIDATGRPHVMQESPMLARNGGRIVFHGVADERDRVTISPYEDFRRELTILGSFTEVDSFPLALAAFRSGAIRMDGVITHRFALSDYEGALDALRDDRSAHKIVITPDGPATT